MLKKIIRTAVIGAAAAALAGLLFVGISNWVIISKEKPKIVSVSEIAPMDADCIMILGAGIRYDNKPSQILKDRLKVGIQLYEAGIAPKILVSGDHGRVGYDEVGVMKQYLIDAGIPSEDIFMDHAGFSTYESMYRAKEIFGVERMAVVTQEYHLYRALYICEQFGIEAVGVPSDLWNYRGALFLNLREAAARDKDIFTCLFKVKPTYLGETIDIHGNGDVTND